jgi:hypothetical protein
MTGSVWLIALRLDRDDRRRGLLGVGESGLGDDVRAVAQEMGIPVQTDPERPAWTDDSFFRRFAAARSTNR